MRAVRPQSVTGAEAGASCSGGWIAPDGRFYPAGYNQHLHVASALRATGCGPKDPWDVADVWLLVKSHGEVLFSIYLTQAQLDTLGDMLAAAPDCTYRSLLLASLRGLHDLEAHPVRRQVALKELGSGGA
jgi:hypothetical protein